MHTRSGILTVLILGFVLSTGPAHGQGRVNILCSPDPAWCEAAKQSFSKATGIQTEFVRLSSGAALARLRAEKDAPVFDVWFAGSGDALRAASTATSRPARTSACSGAVSVTLPAPS